MIPQGWSYLFGPELHFLTCLNFTNSPYVPTLEINLLLFPHVFAPCGRGPKVICLCNSASVLPPGSSRCQVLFLLSGQETSQSHQHIHCPIQGVTPHPSWYSCSCARRLRRLRRLRRHRWEEGGRIRRRRRRAFRPFRCPFRCLAVGDGAEEATHGALGSVFSMSQRNWQMFTSWKSSHVERCQFSVGKYCH